MNSFIIEIRVGSEFDTRSRVVQRWIGIAPSASAMIALLPGDHPSVVDRGAGVLARARMLGLTNGQVQKLNG